MLSWPSWTLWTNTMKLNRSPNVKTGMIVVQHNKYFDSRTGIPLSCLVFTKIPVVPNHYSCFFVSGDPILFTV